jgi:hypothetical protein
MDSTTVSLWFNLLFDVTGCVIKLQESLEEREEFTIVCTNWNSHSLTITNNFNHQCEFEVLKPIFMNRISFWDAMLCSPLKSNVSEEHLLHLQGARKLCFLPCSSYMFL